MPSSHVVVVGAGGILGSALVDSLNNSGKNSYSRVFRYPQLKNTHENVFYCKDTQASASAILASVHSEYGKDVSIFYLAGLADVKRCDEDPSAAVLSNTLVPVSYWKAANSLGFRRFVYASTAQVYAPSTQPIVERSKTKAGNVYTSTKIATENILLNLSKNSEMDCLILRFSNVFGRVINKGTVFWDITRQIFDQCDPIIMKSLRPKKDFIFIEDVSDFLMKLLRWENQLGSQIFNISSGANHSIEEIVRFICKVQKIKPKLLSSEKNDAVADYVICNALAKENFDWGPQFSVEAGIRKSFKSWTAYHEKN